MESLSKRSVWTDAEVKELLALVKEKDVLKQLDGKTKRNCAVYKCLAENLKSKNMMKTSEQVKSKLRMLKKSYFQAKRNNSISGASRQSCPHFDILNELYGTRPVSEAVGLDTSTCNFLNDDTESSFTDIEILDDSSPLAEYMEICPDTYVAAAQEETPAVETPPCKRRRTQEKTNVLHMLQSMSTDYKNGLDRMEKQNEQFIEAQKSMDASFIENIRNIFAEDRAETNNFITKLFDKK